MKKEFKQYETDSKNNYYCANLNLIDITNNKKHLHINLVSALFISKSDDHANIAPNFKIEHYAKKEHIKKIHIDNDDQQDDLLRNKRYEYISSGYKELIQVDFSHLQDNTMLVINSHYNNRSFYKKYDSSKLYKIMLTGGENRLIAHKIIYNACFFGDLNCYLLLNKYREYTELKNDYFKASKKKAVAAKDYLWAPDYCVYSHDGHYITYDDYLRALLA